MFDVCCLLFVAIRRYVLFVGYCLLFGACCVC